MNQPNNKENSLRFIYYVLTILLLVSLVGIGQAMAQDVSLTIPSKGTGTANRVTTQSSDGPGFQMFGGATLGTATGGGPSVPSDTVAGAFVDPRASFRLFGATLTARGFMAVENGVRYAPGSTDAVLNFVPGMYVALPLGGNWSFLVGGAADLQRVEGTTIMNPMMSFGLSRNTRDSGQTIVVSYLYDDVINNSIPQQIFRGYRISPELQKWKGGVGFLAGVDIDRQAQGTFLTNGVRTQARLRIGIGFRPVPTN